MKKSTSFAILCLPLFVFIIIVSNGINYAEAAIDTGKMIILKEDLPHNYDPLLNEEQLKQCEGFYSDYNILPEPEFNKKYLYHQFIGDCVLLYDDQIWQYSGEDRYDKLSFRLVELRENLDEKRREQIESMPEFTTRLVTESEIPGGFIYIFEVCAKNNSIDATNILVASDKEIVNVVKFPHDFSIMSDTCEEFQVDIKATSSDLIRAHNINEEYEVGLTETDMPKVIMDESDATIQEPKVIKSPLEQVKSGVDSKDVECNSGLELTMKNSDDSPACVTPATKIKLVDRGWAKS